MGVPPDECGGVGSMYQNRILVDVFGEGRKRAGTRKKYQGNKNLVEEEG